MSTKTSLAYSALYRMEGLEGVRLHYSSALVYSETGWHRLATGRLFYQAGLGPQSTEPHFHTSPCFLSVMLQQSCSR
jgi:hypothetical protein